MTKRKARTGKARNGKTQTGKTQTGKTRTRPSQDAARLAQRLGRQATETVSDVLDVMGLPNQVLSAAIKPVTPGARLAGPAFCVRGRLLDPARPAPGGVAFEVDRHLTRGCIVVTMTGGYTGSAVIGGNVAAAYKARGCAGLLVEGAVRDVPEIRAARLPTFATHVTPRRPTGRWTVVEFGQPVALPGQGGGTVIVNPGDFILGDEDGAVVVPRSIAAEVIAAAEKLSRIEAKVVARIKRGADREATLRSVDRFGHIRKIVPGAD